MTRSERITIYMTPKQRRTLDAMAKRAGITRSDAVRQLLGLPKVAQPKRS